MDTTTINDTRRAVRKLDREIQDIKDADHMLNGALNLISGLTGDDTPRRDIARDGARQARTKLAEMLVTVETKRDLLAGTLRD